MASATGSTLGTRLGHGFDGLAGNLWPYRGTHTWVRLAVLLGLVVTLVPAAALAFWPTSRSRGRGARRMLALAMLVGVYLVAVTNQPPENWLAQGTLVALLLVAWLWLPTVPRTRAPRAAVWLAVAGAVALALAPALRAAQPWLNYRSWQPFGAGTPRVEFQWDSTYGPLTWPNSSAVMFDVYAQRGEFWKITTLDRFDGVRFLRSDAPPAGAPSSQPPPNLPGAAGYESQTFNVVGLVSPLLPAAGQAIDVETLNSGVQVTAAPDGTISEPPPGLQSGDAYTVTSYVAHPTPAVMRAAGNAFTPAYLPYTAFDLPTQSQSGAVMTDLVADARAPAFRAQTISAPAPGVAPASDPASVARILASPYAPMYRLAQRLATTVGTAPTTWSRASTTTCAATTPTPPRRPCAATRSRRSCSPTRSATASSSPAPWRCSRAWTGSPRAWRSASKSGAYNAGSGDFVVRAFATRTRGWRCTSTASAGLRSTPRRRPPRRSRPRSSPRSPGPPAEPRRTPPPTTSCPARPRPARSAAGTGGGVSPAPAIATAGAVVRLLAARSTSSCSARCGSPTRCPARPRARSPSCAAVWCCSAIRCRRAARCCSSSAASSSPTVHARAPTRRCSARAASAPTPRPTHRRPPRPVAPANGVPLRRALAKGGGLRARVLALVAFPPAAARRPRPRV